jgi:hypothetical protein
MISFLWYWIQSFKFVRYDINVSHLTMFPYVIEQNIFHAEFVCKLIICLQKEMYITNYSALLTYRHKTGGQI